MRMLSRCEWFVLRKLRKLSGRPEKRRYEEPIRSFCSLLQDRCDAKAYRGPWDAASEKERKRDLQNEIIERYDAIMREEGILSESLDVTLEMVRDCYCRELLP